MRAEPDASITNIPSGIFSDSHPLPCLANKQTTAGRLHLKGLAPCDVDGGEEGRAHGWAPIPRSEKQPGEDKPTPPTNTHAAQ